MGFRRISGSVLYGRRGRRLGRWGVGVLLLLCLGIGVMWVRSYWRWDHVCWNHGRPNAWSRTWEAISVGGGVLFHYKALEATDAESRENIADMFHWHPPGFFLESDSLTAWTGYKPNYLPAPDWRHPLGFQVVGRSGNYRGTIFTDNTVSIPYWCPVALLLLLPAFGLWKWLRRRGRGMGFPVVVSREGQGHEGEEAS